MGTETAGRSLGGGRLPLCHPTSRKKGWGNRVSFKSETRGSLLGTNAESQSTGYRATAHECRNEIPIRSGTEHLVADRPVVRFVCQLG